MLKVSLTRVGGKKYRLEVRDDGPGLPAGFDIRASSGIGMQIVPALVGQMDGKLNVANEGGAVFRAEFSDIEA